MLVPIAEKKRRAIIQGRCTRRRVNPRKSAAAIAKRAAAVKKPYPRNETGKKPVFLIDTTSYRATYNIYTRLKNGKKSIKNRFYEKNEKSKKKLKKAEKNA